jgi:hypothetical protein
MDKHIWRHDGNQYSPGSSSKEYKHLPAQLYQYEERDGRWWLEEVGVRFEFPFKVYGNYDHILHRTRLAWEHLEGSLGILLNGLKGTGKTVTAQLIANWAVDAGLPVLLVSDPIPLVDVLRAIDQPVVVIFDEFEKTHDQNVEQPAILTAIDGMSRSRHKRMFLFTTNTLHINENLVNRPSRIRYCYNFGRLDRTIVEEVVDDILLPDRVHLRADILTYLDSRAVLSIDVAKTVVGEANIFNESPVTFGEVLSLTERDPAGYTLEILDGDRNVLDTLSSHFTVRRRQTAELSKWLSQDRATHFDEFMEYAVRGPTYEGVPGVTTPTIRLEAYTEHANEWVCHVKLPLEKTWLKKFPKAQASFPDDMWVDERPAGWEVPSWVHKLERGDDDLTDEEQDDYDHYRDQESVFGTDSFQQFLIRFTVNLDHPAVRYHIPKTD